MPETSSDPKIMKAIRADTNGPENKMLENLQYLEKNQQGFCAIHLHMSNVAKCQQTSGIYAYCGADL